MRDDHLRQCLPLIDAHFIHRLYFEPRLIRFCFATGLSAVMNWAASRKYCWSSRKKSGRCWYLQFWLHYFYCYRMNIRELFLRFKLNDKLIWKHQVNSNMLSLSQEHAALLGQLHSDKTRYHHPLLHLNTSPCPVCGTALITSIRVGYNLLIKHHGHITWSTSQTVQSSFIG